MPESPPGAVYDADAIFRENGPIEPCFVNEAVHALMRALPLDPDEPTAWYARRVKSALRAIVGMHPRDTTELMLSVQAVAAHYAAMACWRLGMNLRAPHGDSTRHLTGAANAARTFDAMVKALERRQAKPLSVPVGRPPPRAWPPDDALDLAAYWEARISCGLHEAPRVPSGRADPDPVEWTPRALDVAHEMEARQRTEDENRGLDIANTDGILPGGGMVVPEDPTPSQLAYLARRTGLMYRREYAGNVRGGLRALPKIRPLRPGDFVP
jgi:hypothetical protein